MCPTSIPIKTHYFTGAEPPQSPFVGQWVLDHTLRTRWFMASGRFHILLCYGSRRPQWRGLLVPSLDGARRRRCERSRGDYGGERRWRLAKGSSGSCIQGQSRHRGATEPRGKRECRWGMRECRFRYGGDQRHESLAAAWVAL